MYEFYYNTLEKNWQNKIELHCKDTDFFVLSFDSQLEILIEFSKQNKDEFDFSELDNAHQLHNPTNKKVIGKLKIETSPVLVLDNSHFHDQSRILLVIIVFKKRNKKEYKKPLNVKITHVVCLCPKQQVQKIIQLELIYTN